MQSLRLVIAEDSVLLREGLVGLLERFGHMVLAAVGDAPSLIAATAEHKPDAVIVDVRMPPDNTDDGLRAARRLRADHPGLAVLVLSQYVSQGYASELLASDRHGTGMGYMLKDRIAEVEEFVSALDTVARGGTVVDPEVVRQLLSRHHDPLQRLSPKEREVLGLIAEGRSNAAIARRLVVTEATVSKRIAAIFTKLDLPQAPDDHRRVLAVLAYLNG
ncbi:response regulator transcription factor [Streptomyces sp. LUP47B]|uniref:response regulator transcription factor n=1 Tax=Streptomyces sp. LUP47B TaxID=1890286 RepID=UPI000B0C884A|nr:response regulator transcription factor [Streptomyces sp. LUP47B]